MRTQHSVDSGLNETWQGREAVLDALLGLLMVAEANCGISANVLGCGVHSSDRIDYVVH